MPSFTLNGLLVGLATGVGQWLVLRRIIQKAKPWIPATVLGYALASPLGLAVGVAILWAAFWVRGISILAEGSGFFLASPAPIEVIYGGFLIGIPQWLVLRPHISKHGFREAGLWIAGTWAGVGLGVFAGLWSLAFIGTSGHIIQHAATGIVAGIITGTILLILFGLAGREEAVISPSRG